MLLSCYKVFGSNLGSNAILLTVLMIFLIVSRQVSC